MINLFADAVTENTTQWALGALAAAVTALWLHLKSTTSLQLGDVKKDLKECKDDRTDLHAKHTCLAEKVGRLEGKIEGYETHRAASRELSDLAKEVLGKIEKVELRNDSDNTGSP